MLLSSGYLHCMPRNNIDNLENGKLLVFATIFVQDCLKNEKAEEKKSRGTTHVIQNKLVEVLVIYYALWNKWPPPVTNVGLREEKRQIIQNKTLTISCTTRF